MVVVFLADGFEEVEALAPVDLMRRAGLDVKMAGVTGREVTGSHGITVKTDMAAEEVDVAALEAMVLPGGLPGQWGGAALGGATLLECPGKVRRCTGSRGGRR